jgi:hypothetical protein
MFGVEQRVSLHQCKDAPCSGATQGMMPSPCFLRFFQKIPTTVSRPISRAKVFFDKNSALREVKMTTCVGEVLLFIQSS